MTNCSVNGEKEPSPDEDDVPEGRVKCSDVAEKGLYIFVLLTLGMFTACMVVTFITNCNDGYGPVRRRTDDTHYPAGWKHLTVEISESNLKTVTIVNEDTVVVTFWHCPIFQGEILDEAETSLDGSCACNNATDLAPKLTTKQTRKIRETECTMWQKVKPVFLEKLKKTEEELGMIRGIPVYHRDEEYIDFKYNEALITSVWSTFGCLFVLSAVSSYCIVRSHTVASHRNSAAPVAADYSGWGTSKV